MTLLDDAVAGVQPRPDRRQSDVDDEESRTTRGGLILAVGHLLLLGAVADIGVRGTVLTLAPGLLLVGAGMGFVLAPVASTVLHTLDPERAGAASGMLTTAQGVGNSLGVAVTGIVFFGALHGGYAQAFELATGELALLLVAVAALTRLLPRFLTGNRHTHHRRVRCRHGPRQAPMPISELLRSWRRRRNLSQLELALNADVSTPRQLPGDRPRAAQPRDGDPPG